MKHLSQYLKAGCTCYCSRPRVQGSKCTLPSALQMSGGDCFSAALRIKSMMMRCRG